MKKLIATLVIGTMVLSMVACGSTDTQNEASVQSSAVSSEAVTTENAAGKADTAIEAVEGNTTDEAVSEDLADNATDAATSGESADNATNEDSADSATDDTASENSEDSATDDTTDSTTAEEVVLEDGSYYSSLMESTEFDSQVVKSIDFQDDVVVVEAAFSHFVGEDWDNMIQLENAVYTIPISPDAEYLAGGGEEEPEKMTKDEFVKYISGLMSSGLSFNITIEDGVAVGFGIWS